MTDPKRVVYCLKLWLKEIQEDSKKENPLTNGRNCVDWIVYTCEEEILDGTYCDDKEYNEYIITGVV